MFSTLTTLAVFNLGTTLLPFSSGKFDVVQFDKLAEKDFDWISSLEKSSPLKEEVNREESLNCDQPKVFNTSSDRSPGSGFSLVKWSGAWIQTAKTRLTTWKNEKVKKIFA